MQARLHLMLARIKASENKREVSENVLFDSISRCQSIRRMMSMYSKNDVNVSMNDVNLSIF